MADDVVARGGEVQRGQQVTKVHIDAERVVAVSTVDPRSGDEHTIAGDYFFSTMPVKDLVAVL